MNLEKVYILENRGILFLHGKDCKDFLQNIITNDINKVSDNFSCFASLLSPQGKYLFDFIILKHKDGFFIDCDKTILKDLYNQLNLYKLRSKVEILDLSNEFVIAAFGYEKYLSFKEAEDKEGYTFKFREDPIILDPRNKKLGGRLIINLEKLYLSLKKLNLYSSKIKEYIELSHSLGVFQNDTKKLQNKIFGLECNFDELNGIDFKKGCYVGQENTSRMKLKNKLTKRLFPLIVKEGQISENESIFFENQEVGKVLIDKDFPFGVMKVKNKINFENEYYTRNSRLKIIKPDWII